MDQVSCKNIWDQRKLVLSALINESTDQEHRNLSDHLKNYNRTKLRKLENRISKAKSWNICEIYVKIYVKVYLYSKDK